MASLLADVDFAALTAVMTGIVVVGIEAAARRADRPRRLALVATIALSLWLALTAALSSYGALSSWSPPRWPLVPISALVVVIALARSRTLLVLLEHTPVHWIIAAQSFRILVELGLHALHASGRAPVQVTFEGRNLDILVGLTAPLVAWLVATKRARLGVVAAWNVLGLAVLASTVVTIARSTPGPLNSAGVLPFSELVRWPIVWLPAFLMPLGVFLHLCSLRQTRLSTSVAPR